MKKRTMIVTMEIESSNTAAEVESSMYVGSSHTQATKSGEQVDFDCRQVSVMVVDQTKPRRKKAKKSARSAPDF